MKIAIFYTTTHGTAEKVAMYISQQIPAAEVQMISLSNQKKLSFSEFDVIVIGGSVHAGNYSGRLRQFLNKNITELLHTPLAIYTCCMHEAEYEKQFQNGIPELLRDHSFASINAGGEFLFEKMNLIQKMLVRKITGLNHSVSKIRYEEIDALVSKIKTIKNQVL